MYCGGFCRQTCLSPSSSWGASVALRWPALLEGPAYRACRKDCWPLHRATGVLMIDASIKGTMDDLLPITGAGRADNINFLSNPTQDASLLRVLTFGNGNHLLFFRFAGK